MGALSLLSPLELGPAFFKNKTGKKWLMVTTTKVGLRDPQTGKFNVHTVGNKQFGSNRPRAIFFHQFKNI